MPQTLGAYVDATTEAQNRPSQSTGGFTGRDQDARHQWRRLAIPAPRIRSGPDGLVELLQMLDL
jgi:hypothetical protein